MDNHQGEPQSAPVCPVGKNDCDILAAVTALHQQLNELSALVRTDPLTGIANYRHFHQALEREIERTQRNLQPTALIMVDIDFFKKVNDTWGHEIGNQALIHIARLLLQEVRKLDIPCRYGGEEFAVILPETDLRQTVQVAQRIRLAIQNSPLAMDHDKALSLTASLGLAVHSGGHSTTVEELVAEADHYLYQAKRGGRNQVCHAEIPSFDAVSTEEKDVLSTLFGRKKSATEAT